MKNGEYWIRSCEYPRLDLILKLWEQGNEFINQNAYNRIWQF